MISRDYPRREASAGGSVLGRDARARLRIPLSGSSLCARVDRLRNLRSERARSAAGDSRAAHQSRAEGGARGSRITVPGRRRTVGAGAQALRLHYTYCRAADVEDPVEHFDAKGHAETWDDMVRLQDSGVYPARFVSIRCPVLMLHGTYDPHPGPMIRDGLKPYIPHLEYREFDRCGHSPWIEEHARDALSRRTPKLARTAPSTLRLPGRKLDQDFGEQHMARFRRAGFESSTSRSR